jgi:leucyl-tRNA synthetase
MTISTQRKQFPFTEFEPRWQQHWLNTGAFRAENPGSPGFDATRPKYYILDMFPYPSGDGLHVGHVEGYTATDILARFHRMQGYNVLHPMGWDAFGLPAEQYAIKTGQHPRVTTARNIDNFRRQLQAVGFSYDWDREVSTTDPGYVQWTQWIFLQLYNAWFNPATNRAEPIATYTGDDADSVRLAFVAEMPVNWCQELGTVLANEEVVDGKSEVGGFPVERRPLRQWMLRITAFADRLIEGLDGLDWPEGIKLLQKNWIGRSEGAEVGFPIEGREETITVFTTRPDTLFGATYMILAPEHPLVSSITKPDCKEAVEKYRTAVACKSDLDRTDLAKDKSGVFTGALAINPVNGEKIPVWIADYVLMGYGTGAIMAVPAHDERDFEFATKFQLPIREVVKKEGDMGVPPVSSTTPFFEEKREIKIRNRNLPHWQQDQKYYFVTWRLNDSLPASLVRDWKLEAAAWLAARKQPLSTEEEKEFHCLFSDRLESLLDEGRGSCILGNPDIAKIVEQTLKHFDGSRYSLSAFVLMPNHVHVLFKLSAGEDLGKVIHSWKSYSAHEINKALKQEGPVWQEEYFDRIVRGESHHARVLEYICENPAKAGLKDISAYTGGTPMLPCFSGEGVVVNSGFLDGMGTAQAKQKIIAWLEEKGLGRGTVNFKLRDWLFSRQRYWGEPFPIVWENGHHRALSAADLPVIQPDMEDFKPTGTPEPPLSKATDWVRYSETARRETNTMPQWAGSCWYYLRFCDPKNANRFLSEGADQYWMGKEGKPGGVDLYVGGTEHAVLHLLYARFWHKVLFDLCHVTTPEPFQRLVNQGMILGPDGQKMSKSRGNVVTPDSVISEYGADSLRLYEMFMGPLEQMKPWSIKGVEGVYRFLGRVWRMAMEENQEGTWVVSTDLAEIPLTSAQLRIAHATIKKVTSDIRDLAFNTAISQMMVFTNEFVNAKPRPIEALRILLPLLSPFAPHIAEELWQRLGFPGQASTHPWPVHDEACLVENEIELVVQVNGKVRERLTVSKQATTEEIEHSARTSAKVLEATAGLSIVKVIVVPGKLVNIVAK